MGRGAWWAAARGVTGPDVPEQGAHASAHLAACSHCFRNLLSPPDYPRPTLKPLPTTSLILLCSFALKKKNNFKKFSYFLKLNDIILKQKFE